MILAAGFGTRLRPLTLERPKPLMEVLGTPLIHYSLQNLKAAGCQQVVINTHHLGHLLARTLGDSFEGMTLLYSSEDPILGTGGAIRHAEQLLGGASAGPFMLIHGDVLCDFDPHILLARYHLEQPTFAALGLKTLPHMMGYGAVGTDAQERVRTIANWVPYQGPALQKERFFCGLHVISPEVFARLPPDGVEYCITREGYPAAIADQLPIYGAEIPGYYCDVGTPERLLQANLDLLSGKEQLQFLHPFARFSQHTPSQQWLGHAAHIHPSAKLIAPVLIDDGAVIAEGATIGPNVVIGKHAHIGARAQLDNSVVLSQAVVQAEQRFSNSLIGTLSTSRV